MLSRFSQMHHQISLGMEQSTKPVQLVKFNSYRLGSAFELYSIFILYNDGTGQELALAKGDNELEKMLEVYGIYLRKSDFFCLKKAKPHLISDELEVSWQKCRDKKEVKLRSLLEDKENNRFKISEICMLSYPCQHDVSIETKSGEIFEFEQLLSASEIAAKYAEHLSLADLLHVSEFLSPKQEWLFKTKISDVLKDVVSVRIETTQTFTQQLFSKVAIVNLELLKSDGSKETLYGDMIEDPSKVAEWFGAYLDDKSICHPLLNKFITPEILKAREVHLRVERASQKQSLLV